MCRSGRHLGLLWPPPWEAGLGAGLQLNPAPTRPPEGTPNCSVHERTHPGSAPGHNPWAPHAPHAFPGYRFQPDTLFPTAAQAPSPPPSCLQPCAAPREPGRPRALAYPCPPCTELPRACGRAEGTAGDAHGPRAPSVGVTMPSSDRSHPHTLPSQSASSCGRLTAPGDPDFLGHLAEAPGTSLTSGVTRGYAARNDLHGPARGVPGREPARRPLCLHPRRHRKGSVVSAAAGEPRAPPTGRRARPATEASPPAWHAHVTPPPTQTAGRHPVSSGG